MNEQEPEWINVCPHCNRGTYNLTPKRMREIQDRYNRRNGFPPDDTVLMK